jgi:hypothetical protein
MARRISVVVSQSQSKNPARRQIEEDLVAALLMEKGIDVTVIPNLYDLKPDGTGMLCLSGIAGDMIVCAWLFPRAAHWTLDRYGIRGQVGATLLKAAGEDDEENEEHDRQDAEDEAAKDRVADSRDLPRRRIYCLDLRAHNSAAPYIEEAKRIASEAATQTVDLLGWIGGSPQPAQMDRYLNPTGVESNGSNGAAAAPHEAAPATNGDAAESSGGANIVDETPGRRWYPVIDFSRCTNCMECIDFCLFGVYGVDHAETILVEQPDNCRKGCPACSRVCPENAIIFPQHKSPGIAGSSEKAGGLKIDLSKLFGAPESDDAVSTAVAERDEQLLLAGRDAVGMTIGIPKRQAEPSTEPKDELDSLMDQLDDLDL